MKTYAFPSGHDPKTGTAQFGMDLRDYFAAKALPVITELWLKKEGTRSDFEDDSDFISAISVDCYAMADAMMKVRDE